MKTIQTKSGYLLALIIILVLVTGCAAKIESPVVEPQINTENAVRVTAEGMVVPNEEASLMFQTGGTIDAVLVEEGDWVQEGDVLMTLDERESLVAELDGLEAELLIAQQALDDLKTNETLDRETVSLQIIEAQEAVNLAQADMDNFDQDQYDDDLEAAEEEMIEAKKAVEDARDDLADYTDLDEDNPTRKKFQDALDDAEIAYNETLRKKTDIQNEYDRLVNALNSAQASLKIAPTSRLVN